MSDQGLRADGARLIASLLQLFPEPKESLDALATAYSERCDAMILEAEASEQLSFVGGRLAIGLLRSGSKLEIQMKAYFQNGRGGWVHKTNREVCNVAQVLAGPAVAELERVGRVEFDLEQPSQSKSRTAPPQR